MQKISYTYDEIKVLARYVALEINRRHKGAPILTFSNGGLAVMAFVARYLEWKPVVVSIDPKNAYERDNEDVLTSLQRTQIDLRLVVVDDILDTGKTLQTIVIDHLGFSVPAYFLIDKQTEKSIYTPREVFAGKVLHTEAWIEFPWEV